MNHPTATRMLLGPLLQTYFCSYLISQRDLSPRTIRSYRDTFRLFLRFLQRQHRIQPDAVCVDDLDAPRVLAFLKDLEKSRDNCPRSRNARLAAIRSFFRHVAATNPLLLSLAQRVLAIPMKRFDRNAVSHLTREQMQAILDAPGTGTLAGQRDRLLLLLLYNTGARVSEIANLQVKDVRLESSSCVHILGKGRKKRSVPLWQETAKLLRQWLRRATVMPESPLLPNCAWHIHKPFWSRATPPSRRRASGSQTPLYTIDPRVATYHSPHNRHASAAVGRGSIDDCHVVGP